VGESRQLEEEGERTECTHLCSHRQQHQQQRDDFCLFFGDLSYEEGQIATRADLTVHSTVQYCTSIYSVYDNVTRCPRHLFFRSLELRVLVHVHNYYPSLLYSTTVCYPSRKCYIIHHFV